MKQRQMLLIAFLVITVNAAVCQTRFGFSTGISYASSFFKEGSNTSSYDPRAGFTGGLQMDYRIAGSSLYIQPGVFFTQKGGFLNLSESGIKNKIIFRYLEVPVLFLFKERVKPVRIFGGIGPSFGAGLSGIERADDQTEELITFGSDKLTDDYKLFELGGVAAVGLEFSEYFSVTFTYNRTLNNISLDPSVKFRNQYLGVRLGFMFGKN
jgi:hypothetical protein